MWDMGAVHRRPPERQPSPEPGQTGRPISGLPDSSAVRNRFLLLVNHRSIYDSLLECNLSQKQTRHWTSMGGGQERSVRNLWLPLWGHCASQPHGHSSSQGSLMGLPASRSMYWLPLPLARVLPHLCKQSL